MAVQMIINQAGPLPVGATFEAIGDDPTFLEVNGSVWSSSSNVMLGIVIELDGNPIGTAQIFSNDSGTHRTIVPGYVSVQLNPGIHKLTLAPSNNETRSDSNDFYTAVIHY